MNFSILFLMLFIVDSDALKKPSEAQIDFPDSTCPSDENMVGKCVRSRYRTEQFENDIPDEDKFNYLIDNYCANLQSQYITCAQLQHSKIYDDQALDQYKQLLAVYKDPNNASPPTTDCLGIARVIFCASQFAYCDPETGSSRQSVCTFLCDTWLDRCPTLTEYYDLLCSNNSDNLCSIGRVIRETSIFLLIIYFTI